jgi:hypothetical protein
MTPEKLKNILLTKVDKKSFIGFCICDAIETGRPSFDVVVSELKDQLRDAPGSLEKIIGREGIEVLKTIS